MERIACPFHEEQTASCVLYPTHFHCFGCGAHGPLTEIGRSVSAEPAPKYKEDLKQARKYIDALPKKEIRGFDFPYDGLGYYLCWPDSDYYKLRLYDPVPEGRSKYKNPAGHQQPLLWCRKGTSRSLCLVEGQINAMSVARAFPEWDVCSPGSASDFKTQKTREFLLSYCTTYSTIVVIVDRDGAGTEAAIHTKGLLLGHVPNIPIVLMKQDANQILCESGKDTLKETIENLLL